MPNLYVGGRWASPRAGGVRDVVNPWDQSVVAKVDEAGPEDVAEATAAARDAFDAGPWPQTPAAQRGVLLGKIATLLERDREEIARVETLDTGKTLRESRIDVDDVVSVFRYYAGLADKDAGRVIATASPDVLSTVVYEPVGVCALIAPWNYPLLQVSWKVAPALAAGCTVVIKPSEVTPLSTIRLTELLAEAQVPPGVVNLVLGAGAVVGAALVESPAVDLVSFTGGISTGTQIMRAVAGTGTRIALELGGKNPNIVFDDAVFDAAVDHALAAAFLHSGQVCSAGARLLVQDEIHDAFLDAVVDRASRIRLGNGLDERSEVGPLVSAEHRAKIEQYVGIGRAEGARLVLGGSRPAEPRLQAGFFYPPTVFAGCTPDMRIVREEIFGPVLTVERFGTEDEAVRRANATDYGLAGAVWTQDPARGRRVAGRLRLGTVWINDYHPYLPQAEWGGFKRSGIGRELGLAGLEEYREAKHVYHNTCPVPQRWFAG
jgi:betaine-aldehyde dehydrogenase